MTSAPAGPARRRAAAVVLTLALLALAVVVAVAIAIRAAGPPSAGPPAGPVTMSTAATAPESGTEPEPEPAPAPAPRTPDPVPSPGVAPPTPAPEPGPEPTPLPPPAPFPPSLSGQDVEVMPGGGYVVALTFDAGANAEGLPTILSTLSAKGVPATFFLTGNWVATHPGGVGQITAAGHRVANHSMTHPGFTSLPDPMIAREVRGAEQAILSAGGDPRPFFRFPFGERDARTIDAVNSLGYVPVRWTVDTLGWKGTSGGISTQVVTERVLGALQPGAVVLMHIGSNPDDGSTLDADALAEVVDRISGAGYGFVTLDRLLAG
ncbi:polysaccharide deacetylase family protein [Arthrobacter sp. Ld5]|uniref:polysaccharide deacetylase family protein n=1 Tax=Arthrobacter sp. Ld5 TaxID=649152 RepID=UPI003EBD244B